MFQKNKKNPGETQNQPEAGENLNQPQKKDSSGSGNAELDDLEKEAEDYVVVGPGIGYPTAPEPMKTDGAIFEAPAKMIFDLIAARRGPHWRLTDAEAKGVAATFAPVWDIYIPKVANKHKELTMFLMTVGAIITGRAAQDGKEAGHIDNHGAAGGGQNNAT